MNPVKRECGIAKPAECSESGAQWGTDGPGDTDQERKDPKDQVDGHPKHAESQTPLEKANTSIRKEIVKVGSQ